MPRNDVRRPAARDQRAGHYRSDRRDDDVRRQGIADRIFQPQPAGDPVLQHCARLLSDARWLGYLSTTGVYGDTGGAWVDETAPTHPQQPRSVARLAAERSWQALGFDSGAMGDAKPEKLAWQETSASSFLPLCRCIADGRAMPG